MFFIFSRRVPLQVKHLQNKLGAVPDFPWKSHTFLVWVQEMLSPFHQGQMVFTEDDSACFEQGVETPRRHGMSGPKADIHFGGGALLAGIRKQPRISRACCNPQPLNPPNPQSPNSPTPTPQTPPTPATPRSCSSGALPLKVFGSSFPAVPEPEDQQRLHCTCPGNGPPRSDRFEAWVCVKTEIWKPKWGVL